MSSHATRRHFLGTSAAALSGLYVAGRIRPAAAAARGDRVRLAVVGIGGRGFQLIEEMHATGLAEFVAFADIDPQFKTTKQTLATFPDVPFYADFRPMLDAHEADIDAVVVATPDHTHVPPAIDAMRRGKHLYCEKPLAGSFTETRLLIDAAERYGVVTQMGNQGHSAENFRQAVAFDEAGFFDGVTKVVAHANVGRSWKLDRADVRTYDDVSQTKPAHVAWDEWLGPRPETPYSREFHPAKWRRWQRFGVGLMGDWGSHSLDTAHRFLKLGFPTRVEAIHRLDPHPLMYPGQATVRFDFPGNADRGPVEVIWRDGVGNEPDVLPRVAGRLKQLKGGKQFYKDDLLLVGGSHCAPLYGYTPDGEPVETPDYEGKEAALAWTEQKQTYHTDDHVVNFLRACRGEEETNSPFSVGGPLVEMIHVGRVAQCLGGGFDFDPAARRFVGDRADAANAFLDPEPVRGEWAEFYRG